MSDEEDYLSDKFLVENVSSSSQPQTYSQRRQESLKQGRIKSEQNRIKSRRQREQECREEGLSKSLFERAKHESEARENKALGIMLKMGFKVGESLGQSGGLPRREDSPPDHAEAPKRRTAPPDPTSHRAEPLPLNEWSGKKGIGSGKRARSPGALDRLSKMSKLAEDAGKTSFRDFARQEYEERRAEARLAPAQRTCVTLDEQAGITFNVLCFNPNDVDSIPKGLMDCLSEYTQGAVPASRGRDEATRLRDLMRADALQPVVSDEDDDHRDGAGQDVFPVETVEEAAYLFRLGPRDRLSLVLAYLRDRYAYCFWCGTKYEDDSDMKKHCPGANEDDHD